MKNGASYILNRLPLFLVFFFGIGLGSNLTAQDVATPPPNDTLFQINRVEVDEDSRSLKIFLNAQRNIDKQSIALESAKLKVYESVGQGGASEEVANYDNVVNQISEADRLPTKVIFLLDKSGSMCGAKIQEAKDAIKSTLTDNQLPEGNTFFAAFHDEVDPSQPLSLNNFEQVVGSVYACDDKDTDLYFAINQKIDELRSFNGRKILFVLTDGKNDTDRNTRYLTQKPIPREEIMGTAQGLPAEFSIYTYGYGNPGLTASNSGLDDQFLKDLSDATPSTDDSYFYANTKQGLAANLADVSQDLDDRQYIEVYPADPEYKGLRRELKVTYGNLSDTYVYSYGSSGTILSIRRDPRSNKDLLTIFFVGLVIIGLSLLILILLVPFLSFQEFRRKYVMTYSQYLKKNSLSSSVRRTDPYTDETLKPNDLIVTKCQHLNRLESWQANDNCCVHYPERCDEGFSTYRRNTNFFLQQGQNKKLNWLWFGAVGGLLAWGLNELFMEFQVFDWFLQDVLAPRLNSKKGGQIADSFYLQTVLGFAFGITLVFTLALVDELGPTRKLSVGRILLRVLIGGLLAIPIFFLSELFYSFVWNNRYFGRLIGWLLFGTLTATVVSIQSSFSWKRAAMGGAIASAAAYTVYFLVQQIPGLLNYSQLLGLIIYGSLLGFIVLTVVERLEEYELQYLQPARAFGSKIFVSKWLTSRDIDKVWIGSHNGCHVVVKFEDPAVAGRHASLMYEKGSVYLEGLAETLVNGNVRKDRVELQNGDRIQLGLNSTTEFKFIATQKKDGTANQTGGQFTNRDHRPLTHEEQKIQQQIKIKKRF